jgi:hypothetical protein
MKHDYNKRKQNRIQKAQHLAENNEIKSQQLYNEAKTMASGIPFGQPILIGHHSESRDRNYRKRIHNKFDKAFQTSEKAKYYHGKAETIESNTAISSDDPEALVKLKEQLERLHANHAFMKAGNVFIRRKDKEAFIKLPGSSAALWDGVTTPNFGYTGFNLANSSASIKRIEQRIADLQQLGEKQTTETIIKNVRLIENVEANRVQLIFPDRVSKETYSALRKAGFIYCKSESAFQRKLNRQGIVAAKRFLEIM